MKQKNDGRWLVACRLPKERVSHMKARGFSKNEIFGFPTKKDALAFISDISRHNVEWMLGDNRKDSK